MAVDAFLMFAAPTDPKLQPIGETQDTTYVGAFEIKDFSFGMESAHSMGSSSGGAGAGKTKFNEFTIKKTTDKSSPVFMKAMATGAHYPAVRIYIRKAGGSTDTAGKAYLCFTFGVVFITKVDWSGPGDEGPEESITFVYGQFGVSYKPQDSTGKLLKEIPTGWDQQKNKTWDPADNGLPAF
jgi:type VI secretion system secreted protein Hcp